MKSLIWYMHLHILNNRFKKGLTRCKQLEKQTNLLKERGSGAQFIVMVSKTVKWTLLDCKRNSSLRLWRHKRKFNKP